MALLHSAEETQCRHTHPVGVALQAPERYVALASFEAADVRPMKAEDIRKGLLRQAAFLPVPTEVLTKGSLEFSLHVPQRSGIAT